MDNTFQAPQLTETLKPKVVAAIPCYNEERSISEVVSKTRKHVDQVIVIDDGSFDGTIEAAKAAGAQIINHGINRGYGEALNSCFEIARKSAADVLVIIDGDGQHNPDEIPQLLAPIFQGKGELIIGSRFLSNQISMPRYRRFGIRVITWLFNLGSRTKVSDSQSGFRAYSKKVFEAFPPFEAKMSASIEILEKARRNKAIIKEVPITCRYNSLTISPGAIKLGFSVALSVARIRLKNNLNGLIANNRNRDSMGK